MQIMTILGSVLDEDTLVSIYDSMARYEIADDVSRRYVLPEIKEYLNNSFDNTVSCDLYISLKTFKPIGVRVFDEEKGEDFFFEDDIFDIFHNKEEIKSLCITICQHLGCKAIREMSS